MGSFKHNSFMVRAGADLGISSRPGPTIFTCKNLLESQSCPYDNIYSSYINLKCLLYVCVTVKIQIDNTSTYEYS